MTERVFALPDPRRPSGDISWQLTDTGLEWQGGTFRAKWMPYACMRTITLGNVPAMGGWRLRVSGPPGAVLITPGQRDMRDMPEKIPVFAALCEQLLRGAEGAGTAKYRYNPNPLQPGALWARFGQTVRGAQALIDRLPVSAA